MWRPRGDVPGVHVLVNFDGMEMAYAQEFPDGTGAWWSELGRVARPTPSLAAAQEAAARHAYR